MSMACEVFAGQPGRSAARKSDAYSFAPVTLATPSMRPAPVAAGFQLCRPGRVSRAANGGSSAGAKRGKLSAMPLAVTHLTNSRREGRMLSPLGRRCYERVGTSFICVRPTSADLGQGRNVSCVAKSYALSISCDLGREFQKFLAHFILEGLEEINEAAFQGEDSSVAASAGA